MNLVQSPHPSMTSTALYYMPTDGCPSVSKRKGSTTYGFDRPFLVRVLLGRPSVICPSFWYQRDSRIIECLSVQTCLPLTNVSL